MRVEVEWEDSGLMHADGWQHKDELLRQAKIGNVYTVGWLMHEDKDALYVALTHDRSNENFFGLQVIARSSVKSMTVLRARREKNAESQSTTT